MRERELMGAVGARDLALCRPVITRAQPSGCSPGKADESGSRDTGYGHPQGSVVTTLGHPSRMRRLSHPSRNHDREPH